MQMRKAFQVRRDDNARAPFMTRRWIKFHVTDKIPRFGYLTPRRMTITREPKDGERGALMKRATRSQLFGCGTSQS